MTSTRKKCNQMCSLRDENDNMKQILENYYSTLFKSCYEGDVAILEAVRPCV